MKGIYLTEEGKKAIEDKIAELTDYKNKTHDIYAVGQIYILKQILSSATILPVEDGWYRTYGKNNWMEYPNGVIIKSKEQ